jgi:hypothetical protein
VPPIGVYNKNYAHLDPDKRGPEYGDKEKWDGTDYIKASQIKDKEFEKTSKICPRIDRTLVRYREH